MIDRHGFELHQRRSPLTMPWEPIYAHVTDDRVILGVKVRAPHTNSRGMVHGGLIAALADNAMGLSLGRMLEAEGRPVTDGAITTSLTVDYLGRAAVGAWVEFRTGFIHAGRRSAVTEALVVSYGEPIARANASFSFR